MLKDNWFSNFVPFDVPYKEDNITYITPEHYYQAMKSLDYNDWVVIASAETPGIAKRLGRKVSITTDWETRKVEIMDKILRYKFTKDTSHGKKLMECVGSIVEWNGWHDNYWGYCTCKECVGTPHINMLGKLLTIIRNELINV